MILPDVNLLVYAYNTAAPQHEAARRWLERVFNGTEEVGLAWAALLGFVRLLANPKVVQRPERPERLLGIVDQWLRLPVARPLGPGAGHAAHLARLFAETGAGPAMVTDVHLAALAVEHRATLYSNDVDFGRFKGLKWVNPLDAP